MISAKVDENMQVQIKTDMGKEFKEADSLVDGIIIGSEEIEKMVLETIRQFYLEIEAYMPSATSEDLKQGFLETILQLVTEEINIDSYKKYLSGIV